MRILLELINQPEHVPDEGKKKEPNPVPYPLFTSEEAAQGVSRGRLGQLCVEAVPAL